MSDRCIKYNSKEMINKQIDERAKSLCQQHQLAVQDYTRAANLTTAATTNKNHSQAFLRGDLVHLRSAISTKVNLINQAYEHYALELKSLARGRVYSPVVAVHPTQLQISQLSMEMSNLLKFDSLPKRKAKLEAEYQTACNKLKDEVKKVKLKISLTELEINEAQKKSAKKSVKY